MYRADADIDLAASRVAVGAQGPVGFDWQHFWGQDRIAGFYPPWTLPIIRPLTWPLLVGLAMAFKQQGGLAEGFSHAPGAKIEVLRRACSATPRCAPEEGVVALVTDVDAGSVAEKSGEGAGINEPSYCTEYVFSMGRSRRSS